ncbi:MAG: hypothetical protein R2752_01820 [Vicinamibacterales bacterium]
MAEEVADVMRLGSRLEQSTRELAPEVVEPKAGDPGPSAGGVPGGLARGDSLAALVAEDVGGRRMDRAVRRVLSHRELGSEAGADRDDACFVRLRVCGWQQDPPRLARAVSPDLRPLQGQQFAATTTYRQRRHDERPKMLSGVLEQRLLLAGFQAPLPGPLRAHVEPDHGHATSPEGALGQDALGDGPVEEMTQPREQPVASDRPVRPSRFTHGFDVGFGHGRNWLVTQADQAAVRAGHFDQAQRAQVVLRLLGRSRAHMTAAPLHAPVRGGGFPEVHVDVAV